MHIYSDVAIIFISIWGKIIISLVHFDYSWNQLGRLQTLRQFNELMASAPIHMKEDNQSDNYRVSCPLFKFEFSKTSTMQLSNAHIGWFGVHNVMSSNKFIAS